MPFNLLALWPVYYIPMNANNQTALINHLSQYVSENKRERIQDVLAFRTRYVSLVLEDIYKDQNASATLRTCECLGVQDIHVIENNSSFSIDEEVTIGSSKWITLYRYRNKNENNTANCFTSLREKGYTIIATTPNRDAQTLEEISLAVKPAFVFGNEESGLSDYALQSADRHVRLPMYGFTQSYNISVSVAVTLSYIINELHASAIAWHLRDDEKKELTLEWYRKIVRRSDLVEKAFLQSKKDSDSRRES